MGKYIEKNGKKYRTKEREIKMGQHEVVIFSKEQTTINKLDEYYVRGHRSRPNRCAACLYLKCREVLLIHHLKPIIHSKTWSHVRLPAPRVYRSRVEYVKCLAVTSRVESVTCLSVTC